MTSDPASLELAARLLRCPLCAERLAPASGSALRAIAGKLAARKRGLAGMSLGLDTIRNS